MLFAGNGLLVATSHLTDYSSSVFLCEGVSVMSFAINQVFKVACHTFISL